MPRKLNMRACVLLCSLCLFLSACAGPPALQLLSLAIDGISYLATDKTIADHGLSKISGKDCKMLRTLQGTDICQDEEADAKVLETVLIPEEVLLPKEQ